MIGIYPRKFLCTPKQCIQIATKPKKCFSTKLYALVMETFKFYFWSRRVSSFKWRELQAWSRSEPRKCDTFAERAPRNILIIVEHFRRHSRSFTNALNVKAATQLCELWTSLKQTLSVRITFETNIHCFELNKHTHLSFIAHILSRIHLQRAYVTNRA